MPFWHCFHKFIGWNYYKRNGTVFINIDLFFNLRYQDNLDELQQIRKIIFTNCPYALKCIRILWQKFMCKLVSAQKCVRWYFKVICFRFPLLFKCNLQSWQYCKQHRFYMHPVEVRIRIQKIYKTKYHVRDTYHNLLNDCQH